MWAMWAIREERESENGHGKGRNAQEKDRVARLGAESRRWVGPRRLKMTVGGALRFRKAFATEESRFVAEKSGLWVSSSFGAC